MTVIHSGRMVVRRGLGPVPGVVVDMSLPCSPGRVGPDLPSIHSDESMSGVVSVEEDATEREMHGRASPPAVSPEGVSKS